MTFRLRFPLAVFAAATSLFAAPLSLTLPPVDNSLSAEFHLGTARSPDGHTVTADAHSLRLDGQSWTPVMGEFHYARYPANAWRTELLKMKAGGIDIVATYVFWIHHEETEGSWNWSDRRDLHRFVATAGELGLEVIVRGGPWCHGEVRNGGLPDWIVARGHVRSDDPAYLASVATLYAQIAAQLHGLLWKDGGPVIGLQLENEYSGPAGHLLTLERLARDAGLDVPLYTRTGWPALSTPMPFGEILPLYGVYAEGFWDRELTPMPGNYWAGFHFSTLRLDANIANEALGRREAHDAAGTARYPFLTCEIGGGMMSSYHRRIHVDPRDIAATTIVKLGSGSNSPGYYMYHGGTNPDGRTPMMEQQATPLTNWNDLPHKNYDFQAPLGAAGQIRPQYHLIRRLSYFLRDHGSDLAAMPVTLPSSRPTGRDDLVTLRWSARSDGRRGFIFVNNYERLRSLPPKPDTQFALTLADRTTLTFPSAPVTIPADAAFIWPFNVDLGGATLVYATAQPLTHIVDDAGRRTIVFAATPGVPAEFAFDANAVSLDFTRGHPRTETGRLIVAALAPSRDLAIALTTKTGRRLQLVLLDEADSLALWKGPWQGRPRLVLTTDAVVFERDALQLTANPGAPSPRELAVFPALKNLPVPARPDGFFQPISALPAPASHSLTTTLIHPAGPPRKISLADTKQPVAEQPSDADFAAAAVYKIALPADLDLSADPLLRLHYVGDVARIFIDGQLVLDDFYNGDPLELDLRRHAAALARGELTLAILPLQKSAPILFPPAALPADDHAARLLSAELITRPALRL